jgi:hypothetical protein
MPFGCMSISHPLIIHISHHDVQGPLAIQQRPVLHVASFSLPRLRIDPSLGRLAVTC